MVFFTCNHCGESLKKNAVEKHYAQKKCRTLGISVGCVDCLKDFHEQEYVSHIKCISEDEKYSAKGFVAKPDKNKGAQKQALWTDIIKDVLLKKPTLDVQTKQILQRISDQANVPRKKPKFINFIRNSMKLSPNICEKVWKIIEEGLAEFTKKTQEIKQLNEAAAATNGNNKAKKRKSTENDLESETDGKQLKKKQKKSTENISETNIEVNTMEIDNTDEMVSVEGSPASAKAKKNLKKNKKNNTTITNGNAKDAITAKEDDNEETEAISLKKKKKNKNKLNKAVIKDKRINGDSVVDKTEKNKKKNQQKNIVVETAAANEKVDVKVNKKKKKKNKKNKNNKNENQQQITTADKKLKNEIVEAAANVGKKNKNKNQNKQQLITADKTLKLEKLAEKKLKKFKAMQKKKSSAN